MLLIVTMLLSSFQWPDSIPVLDLQFEDSQWQYACEHYQDDIYVPVQVTYEGTTVQCEFRIRGATSRTYPKKSIKIESLEGYSLFGRNELNLNAEYLDPTRLRECLSYLYYSRSGQIVPQVHIVEVVFNGETQGAYISVEDVDGDFLLNTSLPDQAVIYKCSNRYTTLDRTDDLEPYSKKTFENQPWDDFLLLLYWLRLCPDSIFHEQLQQRFHYSDLVSSIATNVLLGHCSTYYHNYFLLLDETGSEGKWQYITWDMDRTWSMYGPEFSYHKNSSNDGNRRNTLIWRMWCNAAIRDELITEIHTQYPLFLQFSRGNTIDSLTELITPLVEVDPFREYGMDVFQGHIDMIKNWPENRYQNLLMQFNQLPLPFCIHLPVLSGNNLLVTWQNNRNQCRWRLAISPDSLFTNPDDPVYQAFTSDSFHVIPEKFVDSGYWLQVYAILNEVEQRSDNGPVRLVPVSTNSFSDSLVVNEINYMSLSSLNSGDWIEIINAAEMPVNLAGWSLRDNNRTNLTTLDELEIEPGQCTVLCSDSIAFAGTFPGIPEPSAVLEFNLSDSGDMILLIDPAGNTIDSLTYTPEAPWPVEAAGYGSTLVLINPLLPNENPASWIAGPVGGTPFSPGASGSEWPEHGALTFSVTGPVPVTGNLQIAITALVPAETKIYLFDTAGRMVLPELSIEVAAGESDVQLSTSLLPPGVYFVCVKNMGYLQSAKVTVLGDQ